MLRWTGSIAAVMILAALFGIWRLMQGPIELNWLAPYVQTAIDRSGIGLRLAISGVRLGIDRQTHQLDLLAENVRVSRPDGAPVARFPELATSFALGELLRGRLAPTQVVVERPVLHLIRDRSGRISARVGADGAAPDLGPAMLEELAGPRERDAPLGLLRRLDIRGATVILDDRASRHTWRANRVDLAVNRSGKGVRGDFSLAVPIGDSMPELHVYYRYFAAQRVLDLDMAVDGVEPAAIPPLIPELAQLQHVDAPISGTLRTRIDLETERAQGSRLDLRVGRGRLNSRWLPGGSVTVEKGELHAVYAPEHDRLRIAKLALDLGEGARLTLDGTLSGVTPELIAAPAAARPQGHLAGTFAATLSHVAVARFSRLWPPAFSPGGRRWTIANVHDGVLDRATARFAVDLDPVAHTATVANAKGTLRYHDLTIRYFDDLPPVRHVDGTATFAGDHLDFTPTSGTLKRLKVTGGLLQLTDLGKPTEWLTIDLNTVGPLQDALAVIDMKPLRYAHAIGLDPARISGRAQTRLHFKMPLLADLKLSQIDYGATARITGADLGKVVLNRAVTGGDLALELGRSGAHVKGRARFDGIPTQIDANVRFRAKAGPRLLYRVGLTLDDAALRRLDLDFAPDRLKGPIAAEVTYAALPGDRGKATARLDLRQATLAIPEAGWKKPPDQPGTATIVLDLDHEKIAGIPQIAIQAAGLDGRFAARFGPHHDALNQVDIERLAVGGSDVGGTVSRRAGGGWRADIHAVQIDARHLINSATTAVPSSASQPLAVEARIDRLMLGPKRELRQVRASLLRTGGIWRSGGIDGRFVDGHRLALRFGQDGSRRLVLHSDDLGATLKLFDIADNVAGGRLTVEGQLAQVGGRRILTAHFDGSGYSVVGAPWMAQLLALPSLTGLASTLSGTGLPFMILRGDFTYNGSQVLLKQLLAFGEALGITTRGWIDLDRDRLELRGTVAPAYAINSIVGHVPIIGPLLGGGSQGLFAANYRMSGSTDNPAVAVNPLSALAPGILRQLFPPLAGSAPGPAQQGAAAAAAATSGF
jgi:Protein of unknown function/AsmA-like C-terminal region